MWGEAAQAQFAHAASSHGPPVTASYALFQPGGLSQTCRLPLGVLIHSIAVRKLLAAETMSGKGGQGCNVNKHLQSACWLSET